MIKFEAGKTYGTRSICDYETWVKITIERRTEKTIRTVEGKTFRVSLDHNGNECVKPWGSYSMCPIVGADEVMAG